MQRFAFAVLRELCALVDHVLIKLMKLFKKPKKQKTVLWADIKRCSIPHEITVESLLLRPAWEKADNRLSKIGPTRK